MAPNVTSAPTGVHYQNGINKANPVDESRRSEYRLRIVWINVVLFVVLHLGALYGFYRVFTSAKIVTTVFAYVLYVCSGLGITAGTHRLWSHRSYKANFPLRCILMIFNSLAFQNSIYEWSRDHRVHHKYSETNADPHNATRGFFFAHVGWLLCKKHPDVKNKGRGVDMSDLMDDPVVAFQRRHYLELMPIIAFVIPTCIPVYFWGETWINAFFVPTVLRYAFTLNMTWLVNSAAHIFGGKPYDRYINPAENISVAIGALGEGWHNYHHTFPYDYKAAELGNYRFNVTTAFIDFFAKIGWAYELKTMSNEMIKRKVKRHGDGSHEIWGWGDKDQTAEEKEGVTIEYHAEDNNSEEPTTAQ